MAYMGILLSDTQSHVLSTIRGTLQVVGPILEGGVQVARVLV